MQGNFKPSTSFPFKQYDEKFGKYSSRYRNKEDEKPFSKYDYSSSSDDDNDEEAPTGKYNSDETSSKSLYNKQEDKDDDNKYVYERQKTEETSDDANTPKYREFEASYRANSPKQSKYSSIIKMSGIYWISAWIYYCRIYSSERSTGSRVWIEIIERKQE